MRGLPPRDDGTTRPDGEVGAALATPLIDKASPVSSPQSSGRVTRARGAAGRRRRAPHTLPRVGGILAVLVVLEVCSRTGLLPGTSFPPVSEIYGSLLNLVTDSPFWIEVG